MSVDEEESNDLIAECKSILADCTKLASGFLQRAQCYTQFGLCVSIKALNCSQPCVAPMLSCKVDALKDHSFVELIICSKNFITCAIKECAKEETDKYEPFALAIQNADLGEADNSIIDKIHECQEAHTKCAAGAHGIVPKMKCFLKFGGCLAKNVAGCVLPCIPKLAMCLVGAHGNPIKTLMCATSFVGCAKQACGAQDVLAITDVSIKCHEEDPSYCARNMHLCKADGFVEMMKRVCPIHCGYCTPQEEADFTPFEMAVKYSDVGEVDNGVIDIIKKCKDANTKCLQEAGHGIVGKMKCFLQFGGCLAKGLGGCIGPCVPQMAMCVVAAHGNPIQMFLCATKFVNCAKEKCGGAQKVIDEYYPYEIAVQTATIDLTDNSILGPIQECQDAHHECVAAAKDVGSKAKCFMKFGLCVAKKLVGCTKECMPNMAICLLGAHGNPMKTIACAVNFIRCAKAHCQEDVGAVVTSTAIANNDAVEKMKQCKIANDKCLEGGASIQHKAICYMSYGVCIGKDLAECSAPCLPASAWCMMKASGSYMKMFGCATTFVTCARNQCLKDF